MSYIQSTQILVLLYLLFSFTICTYRVAGSPLSWSYNFCYFSFYFGNVCQQPDLPLFRSCSGRECGSFFLLWGVWPGVAFIGGHWIEVARVGRVVGMTFIEDYQVKGARIKVFVIWVPSWYCRYSHHLPREEKCFLGWRGEGGDLDLGLLEPRDGGWNHWPGVSGHWRDSESSTSGSGVPLGLSKTIGGQSSRGMREVEAISGGSSPTSMAESGRAARGRVCEGSVFVRQLLCESEIASRGGSVINVFVFVAR